MGDASAVLDDLAQVPGYHYHVVSNHWSALTEPFRQRLHGHNQVTDAYLPGMAIQDGMVLVKFYRDIVYRP